MDAKKHALPGEAALSVLQGIKDLYVAKGKSILHFNLTKDKPDRETLLGLLLGRTGNLRAPTIRKGKTLIVGFNEANYEKLFPK